MKARVIPNPIRKHAEPAALVPGGVVSVDRLSLQRAGLSVSENIIEGAVPESTHKPHRVDTP